MSKAAAPAPALARKQTVIENPILNSPFEEPQAHFRFDEDGITNDVVQQRRLSSYFVPIPQAKKKSKQQLQLDSEWTADRIEETPGSISFARGSNSGGRVHTTQSPLTSPSLSRLELAFVLGLLNNGSPSFLVDALCNERFDGSWKEIVRRTGSASAVQRETAVEIRGFLIDTAGLIATNWHVIGLQGNGTKFPRSTGTRKRRRHSGMYSSRLADERVGIEKRRPAPLFSEFAKRFVEHVGGEARKQASDGQFLRSEVVPSA